MSRRDLPIQDDPGTATWFEDLAARHLADRTFPEIRRGLQALSSLYVERRGRLSRGSALDGAGKRAAFALFYGPLHHAIVRRVVAALDLARPPLASVLDLGCGTGAAGAALAAAARPPAAIHGVDLHPWALAEARRTWSDLGLSGTGTRGRLERVRIPAGRERAVICGWTVNELPPDARERLLAALLAAARSGTRVLVVEPIARRIAPWWESWSDSFRDAGGRADLWRFPADLPDLAVRLARAAGLDPRVSTARSLALGASGDPGGSDGAP